MNAGREKEGFRQVVEIEVVVVMQCVVVTESNPMRVRERVEGSPSS